MIWSNKKYNSRHKTIIGILIFIAVALQTFPLMLYFSDDIEVVHGTCVLELPVDKTCTEGGSYKVYILSDDGEHAKLVDTKKHINSCKQYDNTILLENPFIAHFAFGLIAIIVIFVDALAAIYGLVLFIIWLFKGED